MMIIDHWSMTTLCSYISVSPVTTSHRNLIACHDSKLSSFFFWLSSWNDTSGAFDAASHSFTLSQPLAAAHCHSFQHSSFSCELIHFKITSLSGCIKLLLLSLIFSRVRPYLYLSARLHFKVQCCVPSVLNGRTELLSGKRRVCEITPTFQTRSEEHCLSILTYDYSCSTCTTINTVHSVVRIRSDQLRADRSRTVSITRLSYIQTRRSTS